MPGLLISRKPGQSVIIEGPGMALLLTIDSSSKGKVVLNFLGPRDVHVWRGEFFAAVRGFDEYERLVVEGKQAEAGEVELLRAQGVRGAGEFEPFRVEEKGSRDADSFDAFG